MSGILRAHLSRRILQLTNAYQELGKELSSTQIKTVGNYTLGRVIGEGDAALEPIELR